MTATLLPIAILIISIVLHEVSHGYAADALGDPTARLQGRLSLNPLKHLDPFGSVILPILTSFSGFWFGWAKPVPFNPHNLRHKRSGEFLIALAGPASNLLVAFIFGLVIRLFAAGDFGSAIPAALIGAFGSSFIGALVQVSATIVSINVMLAVFNLVPLPPLDGSKLLFALLPPRHARFRAALESYGPFFMIIAVFVIWKALSPLIPLLFGLFAGVSPV